ncbi:uncharacterized protein LOC126567582 [Anopheles maculipalpis]|uniref:uncharacterized protein LOC126567582 n=1 Tax=Anopheles maculipalpis TaxID=1496333 RepID=UPI002158F56A|nr:uncharacterized protein LOC126567582 [Anopheles maculipalpis]
MLTNVLVLVLVSVLACVSAATVDPRCSRYSMGMEAQVLSYPQDCRKFVICDMGGNGQVLPCPTGLYFSDAVHACSYDVESCTHGELEDNRPEHALPQPSLPVQPQPVPVPIPQAPQVVPLPIVPLPEPQPIPLLPVVPPVVEVQDGPKPQPPNWLPIVTAPPPVAESSEEQQSEVESLPPQSVCWDKAAGKVYPIVHDCGLYVVCMGDNNAIVQRCPKGLLYDHKQQRCEFAGASFCATPRVDGQLVLDVHGVDLSLVEEEERADSRESYAVPVVVPVKENVVSRVSELMQQDPPQPILIVPEPEKNGPEPIVEYRFRMIDNHPRCLARSNNQVTVELPHDTDCSMYLVCVGRVAIEKKCPAGQHWNAKRNWCDYASAAGCIAFSSDGEPHQTCFVGGSVSGTGQSGFGRQAGSSQVGGTAGVHSASSGVTQRWKRLLYHVPIGHSVSHAYPYVLQVKYASHRLGCGNSFGGTIGSQPTGHRRSRKQPGSQISSGSAMLPSSSSFSSSSVPGSSVLDMGGSTAFEAHSACCGQTQTLMLAWNSKLDGQENSAEPYCVHCSLVTVLFGDGVGSASVGSSVTSVISNSVVEDSSITVVSGDAVGSTEEDSSVTSGVSSVLLPESVVLGSSVTVVSGDAVGSTEEDSSVISSVLPDSVVLGSSVTVVSGDGVGSTEEDSSVISSVLPDSVVLGSSVTVVSGDGVGSTEEEDSSVTSVSSVPSGVVVPSVVLGPVVVDSSGDAVGTVGGGAVGTVGTVNVLSVDSAVDDSVVVMGSPVPVSVTVGLDGYVGLGVVGMVGPGGFSLETVDVNAGSHWAVSGAVVTAVVTLLLAIGLEAKVLAILDPRCPRFDDPEKTVHLTHPTDCNRFLVCSSGVAYEMRCPDGLEYDIEQRSCDYDYLVRCSVDGRTQVQQANYGFEMPLEQLVLNRPSWNDLQEQRVDAPVPQYKPAVSVVDARCPRTDDPLKPIHLPRTGNCSKFMKCFGGRAYEMDCPAGLEFDVKNNRCDYPALARCTRV